MQLSLSPVSGNILGTAPTTLDLVATFSGGSATEKLDYFKTEITFPKEFFTVPAGQYVDVSSSQLNRIISIDGPEIANQTGKIVIKIGALDRGSGPSTDAPVTIAKIQLLGKLNTSTCQTITMGGFQVVNNSSDVMTVTAQSGCYTVSGAGDNPNPTGDPGGSNGVRIPVGTTNELAITIGEGGPTPTIDPNAPQIKFAVSLFGVEKTPEIKVRLRVKDLVAQLTPEPAPADSCVTPPYSKTYIVSMTADSSGVYSPKPSSSYIDAQGNQYTVTSDGWVGLAGVTAGSSRHYALYVKGPLHRDAQLAENETFTAGQASAQDYDWTTTLLEPGDLPNPNTGGKQDCTVNSADLSLIESRIGSTEANDLSIADMNYDEIVNGNDIAKVVHTLSTKPDDDL